MDQEQTKRLSLERQFKLQSIIADVESATDFNNLKELTKTLALQLLLTQQFIADSNSFFNCK